MRLFASDLENKSLHGTCNFSDETDQNNVHVPQYFPAVRVLFECGSAEGDRVFFWNTIVSLCIHLVLEIGFGSGSRVFVFARDGGRKTENC